MQNDRLWLRNQIYKRFPESSDLNAFLIDFFPDVYANVNLGMSRVALVNQLFNSRNDATAIREALEQVGGRFRATNPRRLLRQRIEQQCPTSDDLESLLVDFFSEVQQQISAGMSTTARINLLLVLMATEQIEEALVHRAQANHAAIGPPGPSAVPMIPPAKPPSAAAPKEVAAPEILPGRVTPSGGTAFQPLALTNSGKTRSENKIVHVTLLAKELTEFDLLRWEQPYPERFIRLRVDPDARLASSLGFARGKHDLTIKSMPSLLTESGGHLENTQVVIGRHGSSDTKSLQQTYWYCPDGKRVGGRYLLSIMGERETAATSAIDAADSWRWTIELADKEELPHLYLRFIWG